MDTRRAGVDSVLAPRLAWGSFAINLVLLGGTLLLMTRGTSDPDRDSPDLPTLLLVAIFVLLFSAVGALITSRYPRNAVGWICSGVACAWVLASFGLAYIDYSLQVSKLPGAHFAVVTQALWNVGVGVPAALLPLLFPTGRPLSPRWGGVVKAGLVLLSLLFLSTVVAPEAAYLRLGDPYAKGDVRAAALFVQGAAAIGLLFVAILAFASLVMRFRGADWRERQQLKWLLYSIVLVLAGIAVAGSGSFGNFVSAAVLSAVPLAIGAAILRHRLYEIDVIVNRTLVYGSLTALLLVLYLSSVVVLQLLLKPLTVDSDLAVAGSTLGVAAMFRPLRVKVQDFIDRRFYRSKYDAAETLDRFSSRMRDEVALASLSHELVTVVGSTMQPAHASL